MQKQSEQRVLHCWTPALTHLESVIDGYGFGVIRQLHDEHTFHYLSMNNDPEEGDSENIPASDLMKRMLVQEAVTIEENDEDDTPELFCLGNEFLSDDAYYKSSIFAAKDEGAKNSDTIYLEPLLHPALYY